MKLRYEPIKHLTNNRVQLCEAAYFVFADDERSVLPLGLLYNAERHTINMYRTPHPKWNLLLYTGPKQAYHTHATFHIGFNYKEEVQELFEGTREDMEDRLKMLLFEEGLSCWDDKYRDHVHSEYFFSRNLHGVTLFGFTPGAVSDGRRYPRHQVGRITHTGNRQYTVEIVGRGNTVEVCEGISLKEARAYAKSLRFRETYAEELAYHSLRTLLDYMYVDAIPDLVDLEGTA